MSMKSVRIPAPLHQELKTLAAEKGQTLSEIAHQLLQESLTREQLKETYRTIAQQDAQMAEESVHYVREVLDPDEDWDEYHGA